MKLHIENLAKIGVADIKLDGITVIVGDNNTGKSTIGKALWAMFDALSNLEQKAIEERRESCFRILQHPSLKNLWIDTNNTFSPQILVERLISKSASIDDIINEIKTALKAKRNSRISSSELEDIKNRLHEIIEISDNDLQSQIVLNVFNMVFNGQIPSYYHSTKKTFVKMIIKNSELSFLLNKGLPTIVNKLPLHNNPYFFDDPAQLEQLDYSYFLFAPSRLSSVKYINFSQLKRIVQSFLIDSSKVPSVIEKILLNKKIDSINNKFYDAIDGQLHYDEKKGFQFITSKFKQPLYLTNLSQGIKSLALLQAAFSHGAIQERDVLILDEPEIHLHPDWQIKYAELVVLLQKAFNLTVLLTTHSPEFAQAIHLYSQIHGLSGELNAYISEELEDGTVTMKEVPLEDWDDLFEKFANSFDTLMALRSDLENPDSDSEESISYSEGGKNE